MNRARLLGIFVAAVSAALYVSRETVGLPGLPRMWLKSSRLVALAVEASSSSGRLGR